MICIHIKTSLAAAIIDHIKIIVEQNILQVEKRLEQRIEKMEQNLTEKFARYVHFVVTN